MNVMKSLSFSHRLLSARGRVVAIVLVAIMCVGLLALLPLGAGTPGSGTVVVPDPTRDVMFIARDMAFYTDGSKAGNPIIKLRAGEEVRLVFRNDDEGIRHNLAIQDWNVLLDLPKGEREMSMVFRVPERPGRHWYVCEPHRSMMMGIVEVTAE